MEGIGKLLTDLVGKMGFKNVGDLLGSDMMKNIVSGGMALNNSMQMGDMMDFQKDLATNADNRTQTLFDQDQETAERRRNLDFTA